MDRAKGLWFLPALQALRYVGLPAYADFLWLVQQLAELPSCEVGVDTRELPDDCRENAPTPARAVREARAVGLRHDRDPARPRLGRARAAGRGPRRSARRAPSTIPSARSCSRPSRATATARSSATSPSSSWTRTASASARRRRADYLPCCWRAGELMRERCGDLPADECERRVAGGPAPGHAGGHGAALGRPRRQPGGLARLRPVPRLLQARASRSAPG